MMERQVANMVRLVDDLLDLSRITRGLVELRRAPLDVREPLRNAVEACRGLVEAAGHELRVEIRGRPERVNADPTRLEQVFVNLLNNAVRYTPPRGLIRISAATEGEHVAIRVADNGIGISADMRERIFEMFARADRALERGSSGLGIGLTLVQRLVAMHGGTVEVRSEGSGRGAEFVVRLPRLEAARAWAPRAA
jgi:signal transduction histidine kinase